MEIINLQFHNMPPGMHGAATKNEDGSFTVFLDPRDPDPVQRRAYMHELEHIQNGDLDNRQDKTIQQVERMAHTKGLDNGTILDVSAKIPGRPGCS